MALAPPGVHYRSHFVGRGPEFYQEACSLKIEGIVSKRADSRYVAGRSGRWLKTKCECREQFVIGGFTRPTSNRTGFNSLLLGEYSGGKLQYIGRVKVGFSRETQRVLGTQLDAIERKTSPFAEDPDKDGAHWVTPKLVAEVAYLERTSEGLRHASFKGICEGANPIEVIARGDDL
ncbi:MAG TPA: hypothetical protein VEC19_20355 [Usitatibacter sp.]|nr:hypothetical protein [Usitatibacter sp.]